MSRRQRDGDTNLEFDSFMDVVTNMVGILIIFVVVFGARSREVTAKVYAESEKTKAVASAAKPVIQAASVGEDVQRLEQQIAVYDREIASRHSERGAMLQLISTLNSQWAEKKAALEKDAQKAATLAGERRELISAVHQLELASQAPRAVDQGVIAVEHLPTPMAQTVFNDEIHFRLKEGRLVVVPLEALVDAIKQDFQRLLSGSLREGTRGGTVGPVRDFTAMYEIQTSRGTISRNGSVSSGVRIELLGLVLEPVREPLGETIDEAMQPQSQLAYEMAGRDPRRTTVTVWVYPDSFGDFRRLKEFLYAKGFPCAARPLPEGRPITGGPQGSRSSAQ